jgi:hypothetical protein
VESSAATSGCMGLLVQEIDVCGVESVTGTSGRESYNRCSYSVRGTLGLNCGIVMYLAWKVMAVLEAARLLFVSDAVGQLCRLVRCREQAGQALQVAQVVYTASMLFLHLLYLFFGVVGVYPR